MTRYGTPCPQGHGDLLDWPGSTTAWYCPHVRHDGNPFYTTDLRPARPLSGPLDPGPRTPGAPSEPLSGVPGSPQADGDAQRVSSPIGPPPVAPSRRPGASLTLGL
jgi:hypothetical protein